MGFKVKRVTKGIYVDGHERADVIETRSEFLRTMISLGFLNTNNIFMLRMKKLLSFCRRSPFLLKTGIPFFGSMMKAVTLPMMIK
jgi:hypothetical protein